MQILYILFPIKLTNLDIKYLFSLFNIIPPFMQKENQAVPAIYLYIYFVCDPHTSRSAVILLSSIIL